MALEVGASESTTVSVERASAATKMVDLIGWTCWMDAAQRAKLTHWVFVEVLIVGDSVNSV